MADFGTFTGINLSVPLLPATDFSYFWSGEREFDYGSFVAVEVLEPPKRRVAGDYPVQLYAGAVPLARASLYFAPSGTKAVIRHLAISNAAAELRTVSVWVSGVPVIPALDISANQAVGEDLSMWVIPAGSNVQMVASGSGVFVALYGIEEVA